MLVLCDFDGTITTEDVTNLLWDRHGLLNWRERLLPPYRAGLATTLQLMDEGWRSIDLPKEQLVAEARAAIGLRDGFLSFVDVCRARNWSFHVVSCGLDWYLKAFLPPTIPFTSYVGSHEDGWRVTLPVGCTLTPGRDFKVHVMRELQEVRGPEPAVFIGDGRNDFPVAGRCDHVFAVRGSTLAHLCHEAGKAVVEFDTFDTVTQSLTSVAGAGAPTPLSPAE